VHQTLRARAPGRGRIDHRGQPQIIGICDGHRVVAGLDIGCGLRRGAGGQRDAVWRRFRGQRDLYHRRNRLGRYLLQHHLGSGELCYRSLLRGRQRDDDGISLHGLVSAWRLDHQTESHCQCVDADDGHQRNGSGRTSISLVTESIHVLDGNKSCY